MEAVLPKVVKKAFASVQQDRGAGSVDNNGMGLGMRLCPFPVGFGATLKLQVAEKPMQKIRFIIVFSLASALALFLNYQIYGDLSSADSWDRMGYAMGSIIILSWLLSSPRRGGAIWKHVKLFSLWFVFLVFIITLYSFRSELSQVKNRVMAAIVPQKGYESKPGTMSFYRSDNGHFHIEALVNGKKVRFLADTGASDVVISPHLARALGYDLQIADFTRVYNTANGRGRGAPVIMQSFQIGSLKMHNLPASVNQAEMRTSLLGMRFFNRLKSYRVQGEVLTISW
ncbi:MAG: TIGR02281 family clan AA aspartic protease [Magnetococcales bacterium]|nr:TIGR02281 family clan AA aspartic protease [Magnetococcales bacterium]